MSDDEKMQENENANENRDTCSDLEDGFYELADGIPMRVRKDPDNDRQKVWVSKETWEMLEELKRKSQKTLKYRPNANLIVDALVHRVHTKPSFVTEVYRNHHLKLLQKTEEK